MINRYFRQELAYLRELGAEFSEKNPALAPMLGGGAADPDVERLLEGSAFLTALMRERMDDDFPEFIHQITHLLWPHYLRPIPSTTIVAFYPKPAVKQSMTIPAGVQLASVPVEGTSCIFRTCHDVEMHPLDILEASFLEASGRPPAIRILLELSGLKLSDWHPQNLRFFLAGDHAGAADLYLLLRRHLKQIVLAEINGGDSFLLAGDCLKPVGFSDEDVLIPYPAHSFPGYRLLQEYFILPEKFLFLELTGWNRWKQRGDGSQFEIRFELSDLPFPAPRIKKENFVLSAAPAINIFPHDADPIRLNHKKTEYSIRPSGTNPSHYQIYSVEKVVGLVQGTAEQKIYEPFEAFNPHPRDNPIFNTTVRRSPLHAGVDTYLSVAYPPASGPPASGTLSIELLCTNGSLPENLQRGDISLPTGSSPEFAEFINIRPPTAGMLPPVGRGRNLLWRLLSHLSLNYISLTKAENLRALLNLYIFSETRGRTDSIANKKRINGIENIEAKASDRLVSGIMMRGQEIRLKLRGDHFAGPGDLFLFGCVLDCFLGVYASINTYIQLFVEDTRKRGGYYQWPARVGEHPLL